MRFKGWYILAGGVGAAAVSVVVWYLLYRRQQMEIDMTSPTTMSGRAAGNPAGPRVQNRERAAGAHPDLQAFLDWWAANGPFPILVAPDGGVRRDEAKQAEFYARGVTKAKTLAETPHGRAAALDLWPVGFNPVVKLEKQPDIKAKFEEMGRIAKSQFNFTWGGDWGWDFPHVEVKNWRRLPYPPPAVAAGLPRV